MGLCHTAGGAARRPFIISPYALSGDGRLVPELPVVGPCSDAGEPCRLVVNHRRERATGPRFPLTVMRCETHAVAFTLYPPGHVPYGREALVRVAPDGGPVQGRAERGRAAFTGTLFDAALDAAGHRPWPYAAEGGGDLWWGTQARRLSWLAMLLGLLPAQTLSLRAEISALLDVETLVLHEGAFAFAPGCGYVARGEAIGQVLDRLQPGPVLIERLGRAGALAGLWGAAFVVEPLTHGLAGESFQPRSARAPPH